MRETVVALVSVPDVPVTVTVTVPVVAVLVAVSVRVLVFVVLAGLNEGVTPLGRPEADKLTLPLKPLCGLMEMVVVPLAPWTMLKVPGDVESAKFP